MWALQATKMLPYGPQVDSSIAEKVVACARRVMSAASGVQLVRCAGCVEKSGHTLCAQLAKMCTCVAVCWKCARRSACTYTAGRMDRVHGYACARRAHPVVCLRAERVGMV